MAEYGLKVKIWGVRGSLAAPFSDRMKYGGNTSCVSAQWEDGIVVFDAGSGIRALGQELLECTNLQKRELHIFFSHLHLDHICGLPFLPQLFQKDWTIHLYGEKGFCEKLKQVIHPPYWPVGFDQMAAAIIWHEFMPGEAAEPAEGVTVHTIRSSHPDNTVLFRLEYQQSRIVYGLDCELTDSYLEKYCDFVSGSNLLIFDGMYTDEEYERFRGFGHSTWEQGIRILKQSSIGTLCISHHDWGQTDELLDNRERLARFHDERCMFAREGMTFYFEGDKT